MKYLFLTTALTALLLCSCSSSEIELSYKGDDVLIEMKDGTVTESELVLFSDSSLFTSQNNIIKETKYKKISSIEVRGYTNKDWLFKVLGFQVLPATIFMIQVSSISKEWNPAGLLLYLPAVLTSVIYLITEKAPPRIEDLPLNRITTEPFRKYSRFPQGLTSEQLKILLNSNDLLIRMPTPKEYENKK